MGRFEIGSPVYNKKEINRRRTFGIISHPDAGQYPEKI